MHPAESNDGSAASAAPIRCELVPVKPTEYESFRLKLKPTAPPLLLDVDTNDAIRVTDPNTKALIAATWLAEVKAKPASHMYGDEGSSHYKQPLLIVDVPGLQQLRIGARPMRSGVNGLPLFRHSWRGRVGGAEQTAYVVAEAEWLTLVQKFGLGGRIVDEHASGKMQRRDQFRRVKNYAYLACGLVIVAVALYMHFGK
jgi:hypothetical protein